MSMEIDKEDNVDENRSELLKEYGKVAKEFLEQASKVDEKSSGGGR